MLIAVHGFMLRVRSSVFRYIMLPAIIHHASVVQHQRGEACSLLESSGYSGVLSAAECAIGFLRLSEGAGAVAGSFNSLVCA